MLDVGDALTLDFRLELAGLSEELTVGAAGTAADRLL